MSPRDRLRLKIIILRLVRNHLAWFRRRGIYVGRKNNCWMLNYLPDKRNQYNSLTRGLTIKKVDPNWVGDPYSLILSFPFTRFYNLNESGAAKIDFNNSEMLEKLDGTMVGVFFSEKDPSNPQWQTRKLTSLNPSDCDLTIGTFDGKTYNLIQTIGSYVKNLQFNQEDLRRTYSFEFIHDSSKIVTQYSADWYGLYLLAGRSLQDFSEISENELDKIAIRFGCRRPRRWDSFKDYPKIELLYKEMNAITPNFEGFIFRDRITGQRIKVKNKDYLLRHHLLDKLSYKNLLPLTLKGETEEVIAYFPHASKRISDIVKAKTIYFQKTIETIYTYKRNFADRKLLALDLNKSLPVTAGNSFLKDAIFSCFKITEDKVESTVTDLFNKIALGGGKQAGQPKKALDILGLVDDDNVDIEI